MEKYMFYIILSGVLNPDHIKSFLETKQGVLGFLIFHVRDYIMFLYWITILLIIAMIRQIVPKLCKLNPLSTYKLQR